MTGTAFVLVGPKIRLDRGGLSGPAPGSVEGLLGLCHEWAAEVGWSLASGPSEASAVIVGPGVAIPPLSVPVHRVLPGQGIDGFRWALRHAAFTALAPPEVVRYGRFDDHVADLRRPDSDGPHRVAVLLHGGFWMDVWRRDLMDGLAVDLTRRGWLTVNVEYRRVGSGGGWPATANDVLAALDFTETLAGAQPDRLLLVGHSAGAQLALWAAGERAERVALAVGLAGLCDLDSAKRHNLGGGAVERFLVDEPTEVASPIQRLPLRTAALLGHTADDVVVPPDQSRLYAAALRDAGDTVDYLEIPAGGHMALIEPSSDAWQQVVARLP